MRILGQLSLLAAFVAAGYAAAACVAGGLARRPNVRRTGDGAALIGFVFLTITLGVLGHALAFKDFSLDYVAQYSSHLLPWHYSLSALWVGQAGSLLLWACLSATLTVVFLISNSAIGRLSRVALGI